MSSVAVPIEVFCSYVHKDESHLETLHTHLSMLQHQGLISSWYDRQITPGADWAEAINTHLETAPLILLLISSDFLASNYCYEVEMRRAIERHEAGQAQVIPIIVRPCDWSHAPFARIQSLPRDGKPVTTWDNQDLAWNDVVAGIRRAIKGDLPSLAEDTSRVTVMPFPPLSHSRRVFFIGGIGATALIIGGGIASFIISHSPSGENPSSILSPSPSSLTLIYNSQLPGRAINDIEYSPDGRSLAMARGDNTAEIIDFSTKAVRATYRRHTDFVNAVTWSSGGTLVASASSDKTAQVWNASLDASQRQIYARHTDRVTCVSWSPDGTKIASSSFDRQVHIWEPLSTAPPLRVYTGHKARVWWVDWSPNNQFLASGGDDEIIQVWKASTGELSQTYNGHRGSIYNIRWSHSGAYIASASTDTTVHIWEAETGKKVAICTGHFGPVSDISWSSGDQYIVSSSEDHTVRMWNAKTGKQLFLYTQSGKVLACVYSPDGRYIASGDDQGYLQLWQKA